MKHNNSIYMIVLMSVAQIRATVPAHFGKTHFIRGIPPARYQQLMQKESPRPRFFPAPFGLAAEGTVKQVFFAPDDDIQKILLYLIEHENKSIKVAMFSFTDGDIAQALINAHKRGVRVEVIVDPSCLHDRYTKVHLLAQARPNVYIYDRNRKKTILSNLMHNKFLLFDNNIHHKALLWTGSCNLTKSAHQRNQENALLLEDPDFMQRYTEQFELLKKRSLGYSNYKRQGQHFFARNAGKRKKKPVVLY